MGFQSDEDFVEKMDKARGRDPRSLFIRQAVAEKLRTLGIEVSEDLVFAPDRAASGRLAEPEAAAAPVAAATAKKVTSYRKSLTSAARKKAKNSQK